jgi:hypothetical protein
LCDVPEQFNFLEKESDMTALQIFGYLSALVNIAAIFPYILDIVRGKTKPERASWIIWTSLGLIAFFSQLDKGATNSLWLVGASVFGALTVSILSIKFGTGGFAKRDKISLLIAGLGILLWFFTKEAAIALFITILVNAVGSYLTTIKSYAHPESETLSTWILATISGVLSALSVGSWSFILLVYPLYVFLANFLVVAAILLGKRRK